MGTKKTRISVDEWRWWLKKSRPSDIRVDLMTYNGKPKSIQVKSYWGELTTQHQACSLAKWIMKAAKGLPR